MTKETEKKELTPAKQTAVDAWVESGKPHRFQKGNKLAVGKGRPPMTPEEKALALGSRTDFKTILSKYMTWTMKEVEELLDDAERIGDYPMIDVAVLRHYLHMAKFGDLERMDWSADHILGAIPKQTEVTVTARKEVDLKKMSPEQLEQLEKIAEANES